VTGDHAARTRTRVARPVVYGRNPVRELLAAGRRRVHDIWAIPELADEPWVAEWKPRVADKGQIGRQAGTSEHQGIVAFTDPYPYAGAGEILDAPGAVVCLDQLQDPRNLGAVARVVDGVGGAGIVILRRGSPEVTGAVCKSSSGAIEHVRVAQVDNLASFLHDAKGGDRWVVGADSEADDDFRAVDFGRSAIIVVGAEGEGLRPRVRSMCDRLVRIPMAGRVGSLNLSVAAALLLYETTRPPQP
jgi:23S rRNA (guanosine2251-2'-O)-methyltransferase